MKPCYLSSECMNMPLNDITTLPLPAKPKPPTLSTTTDLLTGDDLTLTCTAHDSAVNKYEFFHNGKSLHSPGSSKTFTIRYSAKSKLNGAYSCKVYIDSVTSDLSHTVTVAGYYFVHSYID